MINCAQQERNLVYRKKFEKQELETIRTNKHKHKATETSPRVSSYVFMTRHINRIYVIYISTDCQDCD